MKPFVQAAVYALFFVAVIILLRWLRGADDPLSWLDAPVALVAGSAFAWVQHVRSRRREALAREAGVTDDLDNETWVIEIGDLIIKKQAATGYGSLSPLEQLIYCVWVADYSMRNAGDLATASDLFATFKEDAEGHAATLGLPITRDTFALPMDRLEESFLLRFDAICDELRPAYEARLQDI